MGLAPVPGVTGDYYFVVVMLGVGTVELNTQLELLPGFEVVIYHYRSYGYSSGAGRNKKVLVRLWILWVLAIQLFVGGLGALGH